MKILYVEDNDDNIYMLKTRLTRAGFTVIVATDGAQGVAMAASEPPDLILMDLTLPVIDGEEATRRIKAAPETQRIPVIALTANAMSGEGEGACRGLRRLRYQAGGAAAAARQDAAGAGEAHRDATRRRRAARGRRHRGQSIALSPGSRARAT